METFQMSTNTAATIQSSFQQLTSGYQQMRTRIWSVTPTPEQAVKLRSLAARLDGWRDRLLKFVEPYQTSWYDKLWIGGWITSHLMPDSTKLAVLAGLKRFQAELKQFGLEFASITGQKVPSSTVPAPDIEDWPRWVFPLALGVLVLAAVIVWRRYK